MSAVHYAVHYSKWLTAMRENSPRARAAHAAALQAGQGIFGLDFRRSFPATPTVLQATRRPTAPVRITALGSGGANATSTTAIVAEDKEPFPSAAAPVAVFKPKVEAAVKRQVKAGSKVTKAAAVVRTVAAVPEVAKGSTPLGMTTEDANIIKECLDAQRDVSKTPDVKARHLAQAKLALTAEKKAAAVAQAKTATRVPYSMKRASSVLRAAYTAAKVHRVNTAHKIRRLYQRPAVQRCSIFLSVWMQKSYIAAKFLAKTFLQGASVGAIFFLLSFLDYYFARQIKERHIEDQALVAKMEMQMEFLRQEEETRLRMQQEDIDLREAEIRELASLSAFERAEREYMAKAPWGSKPEDTEGETPRLV